MPPLDAPFFTPLVAAALTVSALTVAVLTLAFGLRQRSPGRRGGPVATSKLLWLGVVVYLTLPFATIFALSPPTQSHIRLVLGLFAGAFATRAAVELWLMYRQGRWRPAYGIAHDVGSLALLVVGAAVTCERAVTPADLVGWGTLVLLAVVMAFETVFAILHHRTVGDGTMGPDAVWFAPPGDRRFRLTRRLTWLALVVVVPSVIGLHLMASWSPDREPSHALAQRADLPKFTVIAHRGASWIAPEATLPAYVVARRAAPDFIEVDVQRTKDGVLVAFHDDTVERTTNASELYPERVRSGPGAFTWAELSRLDAGTWFNLRHPDRARSAFAGLRVLRFEEVAALVSSGTGPHPGLYIETKSPERYPGVEEALLDALERTGWVDGNHLPRPGRKVILQSFAPKSLERFRALAPSLPRVLLVDAHADEAAWSAAIETATTLKAHLGASGYEGTPAYTRRAHDARRLVHHYTLNAPWEMTTMWRFGSDGFFTDRADVGMRAMGRSSIAADEALEAWIASSRARPD